MIRESNLGFRDVDAITRLYAKCSFIVAPICDDSPLKISPENIKTVKKANEYRMNKQDSAMKYVLRINVLLSSSQNRGKRGWICFLL
jgi:hypothetical protein